MIHLLTDAATLFRVVDTNRQDGTDNFRSAYELGAPPPRRIQKASAPVWMAISTLNSVEVARSRAFIFPKLGNYVAEMLLEPGFGFAVAVTIEDVHLSVWGDPVKLRDAVVDLYPVQ